MLNIPLELERLKATLRGRGLEEDTVVELAIKAENEIQLKLREQLDIAMDELIQLGVQKDSSEFINDLRPRPDAFLMETESSNTDFSDPPYPMLDKLLSGGNIKPMRDGSGVYKVIPIGKQGSKTRPSIHSNIFDAQKSISAERHERAIKEYNNIAPRDSKVQFRTATSKQNRNTQWVLPAKDKDFTDDIQRINSSLYDTHDEIVLSVIREYEEMF